MTDDLLYRQAALRIKEAEVLIITAGAGIGVDSGLPDFRGNHGFWKAYPPYARLNLGFTDMANPHWFEKDPPMAWGFYGHRLNLYRSTTPHTGFEILRKWARQKGEYFLYTSNVDGQFQKAGFPEDRIVECHGSIHHFQCMVPCRRDITPVGDWEVIIDENSMAATSDLPRCPACGELFRPNILMFGDWNWIGDRSGNQEERFRSWRHRHLSRRTAIVEIGAGTGVPTVRMQSENIARPSDTWLIRINLREPENPVRQGISIPERAAAALTGINRFL